MTSLILLRILSYIKKHSVFLISAVVSAICYVGFTLAQPVLIGKAIDCMLGKGKVNFNGIALCMLILGVCVLAASVFSWTLGVATRKLSAFAAADMRKDAFARINITPLKQIDNNLHGDFMSRMVNDADLVGEGILHFLTQLLPGAATIAGTLIVMFWQNAIIALAVVLITPLSIAFSAYLAKHTSGLFKAQSAAQGKLSGLVNEMINGKEIVEAFNYEDKCFEKFDEISEELFTTGLKSVFYSSMSNPGTRFVNSIVYAAVGVLGAIFAVMGTVTVGQLSVFLTYANQYTKPFNEISGVLTQISSALAGAKRLFEVMDLPREKENCPNALAPLQCEGKVDITHVDFSYTKNRPLIIDFNLSVKPGQRIAIVGPTGCGKTTIINLLMRFYDASRGTIAVDKNDILNINRGSLRNMYGMVLQETWLKNATIADNIAYGKPDASQEEIVCAAKESYAHSFIKRLPSGYNTVIEPGGGNLSAGQKQLLCIARIMLCRPDMLILDEATSSIDTRTEMLVQSAFAKLMQGRTSFVVAHRLSTIRSADCILVMNDGQIIERGTHDELLQKQGFYAKLYNSQYKK
ncbi:MAG: ABC transporter ATP-binding protein [Oscillospiraceae bacterium]